MSMSHLYGRDEDVNVERFEVTDWDLENEFNPERVRHRQSKEEAVYGVWAEDDDDDDERPGFSGGRSKNRDFTAPVSFVSGGVKRPAAEEEEAEDEDEEAASGKGSGGEEDGARLGPWNEALQRAKGGRGARQSQKGGIRPSRTVAGLPPEKGFGSWERHTKGIGQKLLQKMGYVPGLGLGKNAQGIVLPVEAKVRKGRGAIGAHGPERTKQSLRDFPAPKSDEEEEEEFKQQLSQWRKEPGTGAGATKKGPRYTYRTVEELKAKGLGRKVAPPSQLSQVKVIDLTGKSQKVYYSYDQMSQRHSVPSDEAEAAEGEAAAPSESKRKGFALPELEHNLQLLVELTEQDIVQTDRRLRHEKNQVVALQHEAQRLEALLEQEDRAVERLGRVLAVAESCERRARSLEGDVPPGEGEPPLGLADAARVFRSLQSEFYEEYRAFDLATLAVLTVQPLLKQSFAGWDPLKDPSFGLDVAREWKAILEESQNVLQTVHPQLGPLANSSGGGGGTNMDPYHRLMWDTWMPCVRSAVVRWQPRACEPMVDMVEHWMEFLPPWILNNVLEQLIFPKLQREVENWNPLTDTVPIHAWIHPWLPLMGGARLEPLYSPIRSKLGSALQRWHPSDPSAKLILRPWKEVFSPGSWEAFMLKHILPKLGMCLSDFVINPHQQHLDPFRWVIDWEGMLSPASLVTLLDKHFFAKWLQVLCAWLSNNPNYEEIIKWYQGWKSLFSEQLLAHVTVKEKFSEALDIMNRAVSMPHGPVGFTQPGAREHIAYLTQTERRRDFQPDGGPAPPPTSAVHPGPTGPPGPAVGVAQPVPLSFKELVQARAEENNIVFMPLLGRRHEGKQLYTFGRQVAYIDRGVVFVQGEKTWVPTSLQSLVDSAK
ncbi:tuftelin-interacting protein 11 isoform X1 [Lampetra fluviatilis]